jgi:hypothetical protein
MSPFSFSLLICQVKRKTQELSLDLDRATDCSRVLEFVLSESKCVDYEVGLFKGRMTRDYAVPSAIVFKFVIAKLPQAPRRHITAETRLHSQANPCVEGVAM